MIRIFEIAMPIDEGKEGLAKRICEQIKIREEDLFSYSIYRESIDARKGRPLRLVYTVDASVRHEKKILKRFKKVKPTPAPLETIRQVDGFNGARPVIVGFGPSGMFAALYLAQAGLKPLVLERGKPVDERQKDVASFWAGGPLLEESNVQFGEGGAGTFSDGKLTSRSKDQRIERVMQTLVEAGAPEEILWMKKPHVGTDRLRDVVKNIRKEIERLGGIVRFESKVTKLIVNDGRLAGLEVNDREIIETDTVCLGIGHSARDTFAHLQTQAVAMESKAIAVGVRIEHPQKMIDQNQYGEHAGHPRLGAASYALRFTDSSERGVYSFCMCPGGEVVAAASEAGGVVVNGMSEYTRDKENANSALLVQVSPEDYGSTDVLAGIDFQRALERKAYDAGGGTYAAPAQRVGSFLGLAESREEEIQSSYRPNVVWSDLTEVLPDFVVSALQEAIPYFGGRIQGFDRSDAVLTAVESRSSSPVRLLRDRESLQSLSHAGLYPMGEGAGYAGGITSSAIDGIRCAEKIVELIQK